MNLRNLFPIAICSVGLAAGCSHVTDLILVSDYAEPVQVFDDDGHRLLGSVEAHGLASFHGYFYLAEHKTYQLRFERPNHSLIGTRVISDPEVQKNATPNGTAVIIRVGGTGTTLMTANP